MHIWYNGIMYLRMRKGYCENFTAQDNPFFSGNSQFGLSILKTEDGLLSFSVLSFSEVCPALFSVQAIWQSTEKTAIFCSRLGKTLMGVNLLTRAKNPNLHKNVTRYGKMTTPVQF